MCPGGIAILKADVLRMYPNDDSEPSENERVVSSSLIAGVGGRYHHWFHHADPVFVRFSRWLT